MIELPDHRWFIGCQFHPELKSRPTRPASALRRVRRRRAHAPRAVPARTAPRQMVRAGTLMAWTFGRHAVPHRRAMRGRAR